MLKNCEQCGKETYHHYYHSESGQWQCRDCYHKPPGRYDTRIRHSWPDGSGSIGVGHMEDIKRRVWHPETGEVTRDYGRKHFT